MGTSSSPARAYRLTVLVETPRMSAASFVPTRSDVTIRQFGPLGTPCQVPIVTEPTRLPKWDNCGIDVRMEPMRHGGVVPEWTFTDRLIKARTFAGLSQHELATLLGVSERTIKRYEAGGVYKRGLVLGWALACGVDPDWLESGDDGPKLVAISPDTDHYAMVPAA